MGRRVVVFACAARARGAHAPPAHSGSLAGVKRRVAALALALLFGLLAGVAAAEDLVVSRALLEDTTGNLTIEEVAGRDFEPVERTVTRGYSDSAFWLRLRVRPPARGGDVVLHVRPASLDELRLFEPDPGDPSGWRTRVTGSRHPYAGRERTGLGFTVTPALPDTTYYLRLRTDTLSRLSVQALEPREADRKDSQQDLLLVFFITSLVYLLLWAGQSYILDRQPVVGLFAVHQAVYILSGLAVTGYLAPFAPAAFPGLVATMTAVLVCAMNFTGVLFSRALFAPYQPPPLLMRGLSLFLAAFPLQLVAMAAGHARLALAVNDVLVTVLSWYFLLVAATVRREQVPSRRMLRLIFVTITVLATASGGSSFGIWAMPDSALADTLMVVVNGLIASGLLAMLLHTRLRQLRLEAQRAAEELRLAQKTLAIERALKEEAELRARTDYLTGLFNRRHFIEVAERELARSVRYRNPVSLLMIDIDRFKAVNDTWGHGAGDAVLQEVAHLIRSTLRDVDVVGRVGGEEFAAVLLEVDGDRALQVSQRLCATVAAAPIAIPDGGPLHVTISVGIAELKGRAIELDRLLHEADHALYDAKEAGRNRAVRAAQAAALDRERPLA